MSPTTPQAPPASTKAVIAAVSGNALEFYDFVSYAYFAVYIGKAFFPSSSGLASLLASVSVFGVGFIARPLGAWLIGRYADRRGRRPALMLTMALMTLGTLGLALTPGYSSIGLAAPALLVLARLVQGFALGGDVGPATAFLLEAAARGRRGLATSWQLASQGASTVVGGSVGLMLTHTLSTAEMQAWGWRLPFVVGLFLIPVAFYLRKNMPETGSTTVLSPAAPRLFEQNFVPVVVGALVIAGSTIATYLSLYMTTYAIATLRLSPSFAMSATVVVGLGLVVGALVGGVWSDRSGPALPSVLPRLALAIAAPMGFVALNDSPNLTTLLAVSFALAVLTATSGAAAIHLLSECLETAHRASGISIAYAAATAIFGGTTQAIVTWLIAATGSAIAPAWYASAASMLTCVALWALLRHARLAGKL